MLFIFRFYWVFFFVMFFEFGLFSPSPSSTALLTSRVEDLVWISWSGPNKQASVDFWNRNNKGVDTFFWTSRVVDNIGFEKYIIVISQLVTRDRVFSVLPLVCYFHIFKRLQLMAFYFENSESAKL